MSVDEVRQIAQEAANRHAGHISTHYTSCYLDHAGCLAALIVRHLDEAVDEAEIAR